MEKTNKLTFRGKDLRKKSKKSQLILIELLNYFELKIKK